MNEWRYPLPCFFFLYMKELCNFLPLFATRCRGGHTALAGNEFDAPNMCCSRRSPCLPFFSPGATSALPAHRTQVRGNVGAAYTTNMLFLARQTQLEVQKRACSLSTRHVLRMEETETRQ